MSGKKSRKDESESGSDEEEDKPTLVTSVPTLKPPRSVTKPPAVAKAAPPAAAAPAPQVSVSESAGGELYSWAKAISLAKPQLEELYGRASSENSLPFQIRNIFGDILCPTKDGQDFYLPVEQINLDAVKGYYDSIVTKLPDSDLNGKALKSWYQACTKRGLVKCFQETMPLMQREITLVLELINKEAEARRLEPPPVVSASTSEADASATPGSKRKAGSSATDTNADDSKRQREEPARPAFTSVSDFRRSCYSHTPVTSAKANQHDLNDGYDITALVEASRGAADVGASRKIEVASYRNRALPF